MCEGSVTDWLQIIRELLRRQSAYLSGRKIDRVIKGARAFLT